DRLESFEDGDVPSGVVRFSHEKSPANSAFAGKKKSIRRSGRSTPERARFLWLSRQIRAGLDPRSPPSSRPPPAHAPERPRREPAAAIRESNPAAVRA